MLLYLRYGIPRRQHFYGSAAGVDFPSDYVGELFIELQQEDTGFESVRYCLV